MCKTTNRLARLLICGPALAIGILLAFPAAGFPQDDAPSKPFVTFSGAQSRIDKPSYHLVTSAKDWTNLWLRHSGKEEREDYDYLRNPDGVPEVNFDECMVVAVFQGKQTNIARLEAVSLSRIAGLMTLRFQSKGYQTGSTDKGGGAKDVTPYAFFVVPRSPNPLVLEQDVHNIKGDPPKWKKVLRFR